jgi:hypothetical protein
MILILHSNIEIHNLKLAVTLTILQNLFKNIPAHPPFLQYIIVIFLNKIVDKLTLFFVSNYSTMRSIKYCVQI